MTVGLEWGGVEGQCSSVMVNDKLILFVCVNPQ